MREYIPGLVSVIMPAYNADKYIAEAINSVLTQEHYELELIVIDDGSSDGTCSTVERIAAGDSRVRLYKNDTNSGVAATRNRGMDIARGEYVALLDSDDIWKRDRLSKQLQAQKESGAELVCSSYELMNEEGVSDGRLHTVPEVIKYGDMLSNNYIGTSTVLMTAKCLEYRFLTDFFHEDYALWLKMIKDGIKVAGVDEPLVSYRVMAGSKAGNKLKSAKYRWQIYRAYLKLPFFKSVGYLIKYATAGVSKYYFKKANTDESK